MLLSPPLLSAQAPQQCASNATIQEFTTSERLQIQAWLHQLDQSPQAFTEFMRAAQPKHANPLRLGRSAERLLEFFLRFGPTHRLIAANIPLRHSVEARHKVDHTTVGEIDFLLTQLATGAAMHWELAVKFFLCTQTSAVVQAHDFVGPDRAEWMPQKLEKLLVRQLSHVPPAPHDVVPWQRQAFARGWMFYPHIPEQQTRSECAVLNTQHLRGQWLRLSDANTLTPGNYVLVDRKDWMAQQVQCVVLDAQTADSTVSLTHKLLTREQMIEQIQATVVGPAPPQAKHWPSAQLVARIEQGEATAGMEQWLEVERCFIVPDDFQS